MRAKNFDPLQFIPRPEAIQDRLEQTERLASRLRILLRVAREIYDDEQHIAENPATGRGVGHAS